MKNILLFIISTISLLFASTWQDDFSVATSNWTKVYNVSGNMAVSSGTFNATTSNARNAAYYNASGVSDSMLVSAKINYTTNVSQTMVCARVKTGVQSFYYFGYYSDNTGWRMGRFVDGTNTTILSGTRSAIASGSIWSIRVWADTIVGYINGTPIDTGIDANITGDGYGGVYVYAGTTYGNFDDFSVSFDVPKVVASITSHPHDTTVTEDSVASFTVQASGTGLIYQWVRNNSNVGTSNSTYQFTPTLSNNGDSVWCTVSADTGGPVTSNKAYLTVLAYNGPLYDTVDITSDVNNKKEAATIVVQPVNDSVAAGEISYFTVQATGTTLTYQWMRNGSNVGSNSNIYSFTTSSSNNGDSVWCVVSADTGSAATSTKAYLKVTGTSSGPTITDQPDDYNIDETGMAIFSIAATFDGALTYQWYRNDSLITGATTSTVLMTNVGRHLNNASVYCMVNGTVKSNTVHLTVNYITTQPRDTTVIAGQSVTFSVSGNGFTEYKWIRNDSLKSTNATYSFTATDNLNGAKIYCIVNTLLTSDTVTLTVNPAPDPVITQQPKDTTVTAGSTATFTVAGTNITSYQWYGNETLIPGATNSTYSFTATYSLNGSEIYCIINDSLSTDTVALTVNPPFYLVNTSDTIIMVAGSVGAIGFQWYRNDTLLVGATDSILAIEADSVFYSGSYTFYCMVSNGITTLKSTEWKFNQTTGPPATGGIRPIFRWLRKWGW